MNTALSNEMFWLVATIVMTALFWVPYILNRMLEQGIGKALWDPYGHTATNTAWAQRMMAAHYNAVENLVVFAPLVIALELLGLNTTLTAYACMAYFITRLAHYLVFTFALPLLRVVTFLAGFTIQMLLAYTLLF